MTQDQDDPEPCKLRNRGGSECGSCICNSPNDCPESPLFTPIGMMISHLTDQFTAKVENE